jgi:outer membrane immunogenic protein
MKKLFVCAALLALSAGGAFAADLPSRKAAPVLPPPPPPPPMWTGFYVGLNAGGTWANSNRQTIAVGPIGADDKWSPGFLGAVSPAGGGFGLGYSEQFNYLGAFSAAASASGVNSGANAGFIGGGQIGYNWQFYNSVVAGVEADIQGIAGNHGSRSVVTGVPVPGVIGSTYGDAFVGVTSVRGSLDYLGTVRGRLGWLFNPTLLIYGTGGLAYGGVTLNSATAVYTMGGPNNYWASLSSPVFGGVNYSNTQVGWTAGGGLEWMFWPNWSAKVEYLYYDLGSVTQNFAMVSPDPIFGPEGSAALFGGQVRARLNGNVVRAGLNYHFNWGAPAPVVAKY